MEKIEKLTKLVINELEKMVKNGGEGSGDFDHAGRPGLVGGSEPTESRAKRGFKSKSERKEVKKEENKKIKAEEKEDKRDKRKVNGKDIGLEEKNENIAKILEGGIKENTDKFGRVKFSKGNKWANVQTNGGHKDSWIASYGQIQPTGIKGEKDQEQLFDSRFFKTEKGARKWALEKLKRITNANNSLYKHEYTEY